MARRDRLYALVEELRSRAPRPMTRSHLAERLEISPRTVERDVETLQRAGVPIWTQRGRAGGYVLDPRWHLPPLNLDIDEALAIVSAISNAEGLPFEDARRRAAQKIVAVLRPSDLGEVEELSRRFRVERPRPAGPKGVRTAIEHSVVARKVLKLQYLDRSATVTTRLVEAHALEMTPSGSVLLGWCRLRNGPRSFALDRIGSVTVTDETAPERDLALLADWSDAVPVTLPGRPEVAARARSAPPARTLDQTGSSPAFALSIAAALPGVRVNDRTCAVGRTTFLELDGDDVLLHVTSDGTPFRCRVDRLARDDLRSLVHQAWRAAAPSSTRTPRRNAARPLEYEHVRELALALPGVTEDVIERRGRRSVRWNVGGTMFAKYAEAGNLLPPDLDDTLMIRRCPDRDALLAQQPARFFVTRHYADAPDSTVILTRLSENSVRDLAEIGELLHESWRLVAPKRLAANLKEH